MLACCPRDVRDVRGCQVERLVTTACWTVISSTTCYVFCGPMILPVVHLKAIKRNHLASQMSLIAPRPPRPPTSGFRIRLKMAERLQSEVLYRLPPWSCRFPDTLRMAAGLTGASLLASSAARHLNWSACIRVADMNGPLDTEPDACAQAHAHTHTDTDRPQMHLTES